MLFVAPGEILHLRRILVRYKQSFISQMHDTRGMLIAIKLKIYFYVLVLGIYTQIPGFKFSINFFNFLYCTEKY